MDFDITTVRKLTALRNRMPDDGSPLRQRLTNMLNTAEAINAADDPEYKDKLIAAFKTQWAEYLEAGGAV